MEASSQEQDGLIRQALVEQEYNRLVAKFLKRFGEAPPAKLIAARTRAEELVTNVHVQAWKSSHGCEHICVSNESCSNHCYRSVDRTLVPLRQGHTDCVFRRTSPAAHTAHTTSHTETHTSEQNSLDELRQLEQATRV